MILMLQDLNNIRRNGTNGINKHWIYKTDDDYKLMCNYMEKIKYCIEDLNEEMDCLLKEIKPKGFVYSVVLIDWFKDSCENIKNLINEKVIKNSHFLDNHITNKYLKFFNAIRSFVVAHPLNTDRHKDFGFEGDLICSDIRTQIGFLGLFDNYTKFMYIDVNGNHKGKSKSSNIFLKCYSKKDINNWYVIGLNIYDIIEVAENYIKEIYNLDDYLAKQKKSDYKE